MPKIEFILPDGEDLYPINTVGISSEPQTARNYVPREYKDLSSFNNNDLRDPSVKKCMPFLDAMTAGYIIPFHQDYIITIDHDKKEIQVHTKLIKPMFHDSKQLPKNYQDGDKLVGKFSNKWIVKTPPGYSCLFMHPVNTPKTDFEIVSGVVDTDEYDKQILFPYYWRRYKTEGKDQTILRKNSPMVQVIPFKRESWTSSFGIKKQRPDVSKWAGHYMDVYKKVFWKKKKYD
jgi:hypothetical protein